MCCSFNVWLSNFYLVKVCHSLFLCKQVPLGMRSEARFHILNDGFDNLELRYRLPLDITHVPLSIEFPEGSLIGIAKSKLPVLISFQAPHPMSFTAAVHFLDEEGASHNIVVTGTTDNSILTIQPFLEVDLRTYNPALSCNHYCPS